NSLASLRRPSRPARYNLHQLNTRLALTPCARATPATDAPSANASPTIRCFSSSDRYCRFVVTGWVQVSIIAPRGHYRLHNQFIHYLIFADGAGNRRHCRIFGDLVYKMLAVEAANFPATRTTRHDGNAVHIRLSHHGFHGPLDVAIGKLSQYVRIEKRV